MWPVSKRCARAIYAVIVGAALAAFCGMIYICSIRECSPYAEYPVGTYRVTNRIFDDSGLEQLQQQKIISEFVSGKEHENFGSEVDRISGNDIPQQWQRLSKRGSERKKRELADIVRRNDKSFRFNNQVNTNNPTLNERFPRQTTHLKSIPNVRGYNPFTSAETFRIEERFPFQYSRSK